MLLSYGPTFQCCADRHTGGRVLSQILWDLREGIGSSIEALGQTYIDQLAVYTTTLLSNSNTTTMDDLYSIMFAAADNGDLNLDCPIGEDSDCADEITAAFQRHGVCVDGNCVYVQRNCSTGCTGVSCLSNDDGDWCTPSVVFTPSSGKCSRSAEETPTCCRDVCDNSAIYDCGIFGSETACRGACIGQEWNYTYRECLISLDSGDCDACDPYAP